MLCSKCVIPRIEGKGIRTSQCPTCKQPGWKRDLRPVHQLANMVQPLTALLEEGICPTTSLEGPARQTGGSCNCTWGRNLASHMPACCTGQLLMVCIQCAADLLISDPEQLANGAPDANPTPALRQHGSTTTGDKSNKPAQHAAHRENWERPSADARRKAGNHSNTARRHPAGRKRVTFADAAALQQPDALHAPSRSAPAAAQQITEQEGLVPDTCEVSGLSGYSVKSGSQQGTKQEDGSGTSAADAAGRTDGRARGASNKEAATEEDTKPTPGWLKEMQQPAAPVRPFTRAKQRRAAAAMANKPPVLVPGNNNVAERQPPARADPASQKALAVCRGAARQKRAGAEGGLGSSAPQPHSTERRPATAVQVGTGSSCNAEEQSAGRSSRSKRPRRQGRSRTAEDRSFIQQFTAEAGSVPGCALSKSLEAVDEFQQEFGQTLEAAKAPLIQQSPPITVTPAEGAHAMPEGDMQPGTQPDDPLHPSQSELPAGEVLHPLLWASISLPALLCMPAGLSAPPADWALRRACTRSSTVHVVLTCYTSCTSLAAGNGHS